MKKALALALTAFMVLSLATAAFAVEVSYEGKVEVTWGGESQGDDKTEPGFAEEALEAKVTVDFTKDYGNGVSAGVVTIVEAHADVYDDENDVNKEFKFDGAGWVQLERDLFAAKASTSIDGGVGKDLGEFGLDGDPGLGLDLFLVDGLTINTLVNAGPDYRFLVKGEYDADLFSIGGGYQNDTIAEKTAFGVYGSANLIDGLTINGEYGNRKIADADAITAFLASAAYEVDALSATATFLMNDFGFVSLDAEDADDWRFIELYRATPLADVMVIAVDASYNITDALAAEGYFDYILSAELAEIDVKPEDPYAYKLGASYTIIEPLEAKAWFKAVGSDLSQVGGNVAYTLAEDVTASFEVTSTTAGDADAKLAYTAKIEASF